ncbi:MAG: uracil-xanthine permease family protein, partial [Acidobacteriota bacterium]
IFFLQIRCRGLFNGILARGAIFFSIWVVGLGIAGMAGKVNWALVAEKPWLEVPRLFPYGGPGFGWQFGVAAVLGILAGYLGSMVESIGDYAATCAVSGETFTVRHMNRGIFAEGLGCVVASAFGGMPCTSYTQNIGIIATTRVASRLVVQVAAGVLLLYGLCPKFGALLVAMPRSVLGGVFLIVCGMIAVSGIRLLSAARGSAADLLVVGTTLILAVSIPVYSQFVLGEEWLQGLPSFLRLLLTNTVVLAVITGITLNLLLNILPRREPKG